MHEVIQAAFDWTDSHLHQFIVGGLVIGAPEFDDDGLNDHQTFEATEVLLRDLDLDNIPQPRILYEYDFGDRVIGAPEFDDDGAGPAPGRRCVPCLHRRRTQPPTGRRRRSDRLR